jgi:hypothetical protein
VDNLVQAVLLALWKPEAVGEMFFITDPEVISWKQCINDHAELLEVPVPHVSESDLSVAPKERVILDSVRAIPRVLFSSEFRGILRQIPMIKTIEKQFYGIFESLSAETQQTIRFWLQGPLIPRKNGLSENHFDSSDNLIAAQARKVIHSCEKARRQIGYTAPVSYREGMMLTEAWLRYARII